MWNIKRIVKKGKYLYAVVPEHPNATKNGYVLEHRVVMENSIGRILTGKEVVHHINGDTHDNSIENLRLFTSSGQHLSENHRSPSNMVKLKCPWCGRIFERRRGSTRLVKGGRYNCCSTTCRGKLSRAIQLHGETDEIRRAIDDNIVEEYVKQPQ